MTDTEMRLETFASHRRPSGRVPAPNSSGLRPQFTGRAVSDPGLSRFCERYISRDRDRTGFTGLLMRDRGVETPEPDSVFRSLRLRQYPGFLLAEPRSCNQTHQTAPPAVGDA